MFVCQGANLGEASVGYTEQAFIKQRKNHTPVYMDQLDRFSVDATQK